MEENKELLRNAKPQYGCGHRGSFYAHNIDDDYTLDDHYANWGEEFDEL